MPITYCSSRDNVFSYTTGTGIEKGMCLFNGHLMPIPEAEQMGIDLGWRIPFRDTESFWSLAAHKMKFYGADSVRELAEREEMNPDDVLARAMENVA